jgi:osmotically-inducible protein OsmY
MTTMEPGFPGFGGAQWVADEVMDAEMFLCELIVEEIRNDPGVGSAEIVVSVQNAVIILQGRVADARTHVAVLRRARGIPGVLDVRDRLVVDGDLGPR